MKLTLCPDASPSFFHFFDISIAPPFLLYAYIPILCLSLFFGFYILIKNRTLSASIYLAGIIISFAFWIFLILIQWTGAYLEFVHLAWQLLILPEVCIYFFAVLFAYTFLNLAKNNLPTFYKTVFIVTVILVSLLMPSRVNIEAFDFEQCQGVLGKFWNIIYIIELGILVWIGFIAFQSLYHKDQAKRTMIFFTSFGIISFLGIFWASNYFGELTKLYEINLIGPIGMMIFLSILSYIIIKFNVFSLKVFSAQFLVIALIFLIGALLFLQKIEYIHIVVLFTLGLVSILGFILIRSVKREIEQREKIEKLAKDLEKANEQLKELDHQKDELLGIIVHQLATPVSSVKWNLEMLRDGDMGRLSKTQEESVISLQDITNNLTDLVSMILDVSRIQLGRMKVDRQELNLKTFFKEILEVIEPKAKEKKVKFKVAIPNTFPKAMLDKRYTHMTIENLLSNAIKYTSKGGNVYFNVEFKKGVMYCEVKDTGVGIPKQDQNKIFGKLFRASNVRNAVDGNGFGLYVAKGAVEAQDGKIWFESEEGKGTTFFVKLPLNSSKVK